MHYRRRLGLLSMLGLRPLVGCAPQPRRSHVRRQAAPRVTEQSSRPAVRVRPQCQMLVQGSAEFQGRVWDAISLLAERAPSDWQLVQTYVGRVSEFRHSCMDVHAIPPTFLLSARAAFHSETWCASDIVHDANHSKLYFDYARSHPGNVPGNVYVGPQAESVCLAAQLSALQRLGAPSSEIRYLQSVKPTFSDRNHDGKVDWEDYVAGEW